MEKRQCLRIPFRIESKIKYNDKILEGETLNLSLQGILINISEQIPIDSIVDVEMELIGDSSKEILNVSSKVVRSDKGGTAIKMMKIDLDSFMDLRDIIINNNGDSDKIMAEFHNFILQNSTA